MNGTKGLKRVSYSFTNASFSSSHFLDKEKAQKTKTEKKIISRNVERRHFTLFNPLDSRLDLTVAFM